MIRIAIVAAVLISAAYEAQAEPIYRCGDTYTNAPCAGGRVIDIDPAANVVAAETRRPSHDISTSSGPRVAGIGIQPSAIVPPPVIYAPPVRWHYPVGPVRQFGHTWGSSWGGAYSR